MRPKVKASCDVYPSPLFAAHISEDVMNPTTAPAMKISASIIRSDAPPGFGSGG